MDIGTNVVFPDDNEDNLAMESKKYIIRLKDEVDLSAHIKNHLNKFSRGSDSPENKEVFRVYKQFASKFINAYAGKRMLLRLCSGKHSRTINLFSSPSGAFDKRI